MKLMPRLGHDRNASAGMICSSRHQHNKGIIHFMRKAALSSHGAYAHQMLVHSAA